MWLTTFIVAWDSDMIAQYQPEMRLNPFVLDLI